MHEMKIVVNRWEFLGKFKAEMLHKGRVIKRLEADTDLDLSHEIGKTLDELIAMIQEQVNIKVEQYIVTGSGWRILT